MRVSPDGNACFARQENGQVFADGDEQKAGRFREWQRGYEPVVIKLVFGVFLYDNSCIRMMPYIISSKPIFNS